MKILDTKFKTYLSCNIFQLPKVAQITYKATQPRLSGATIGQVRPINQIKAEFVYLRLKVVNQLQDFLVKCYVVRKFL